MGGNTSPSEAVNSLLPAFGNPHRGRTRMPLSKRLAGLAFQAHLPRRTVRLRLTAMYGALFLRRARACLRSPTCSCTNRRGKRSSSTGAAAGGQCKSSHEGRLVRGGVTIKAAQAGRAPRHRLQVSARWRRRKPPRRRVCRKPAFSSPPTGKAASPARKPSRPRTGGRPASSPPPRPKAAILRQKPKTSPP